MVFILSNQYEKRYTPYMAKVAPQHLVHTPQLGRYLTLKLFLLKQSKIFYLGRQPKRMSMSSSGPMKAFWRFIRNYICHNAKIYYTYVLLVGMGAYNFHYWWIVSYYRKKNYFRSLEYAMEAEK